jgi:hypothetical protein
MNRKKNYSPGHRSQKCDLIEGIIIGMNETNKLNTRNEASHTPATMIRKLGTIANECSDPKTKTRAQKAIELLTPLKQDIPATVRDRARIFQHTKDSI